MTGTEISYALLTELDSDEYKYELTADYTQRLVGKYLIGNHENWVNIRNGVINIANKYRWDGPSGPTLDTPDWMRASLVHDALYQLMKVGALSIVHRRTVDAEMLAILEEDGMGWVRRWYSWLGVRVGGGRVIRKWRKAHDIDVYL